VPKRRFPYAFLLRQMTWMEFKIRDQGTLLGFLWTLLYPILMFIVLYALFIRWMGKFVDQYAAYLLIGLVVWNFFHKATSSALMSFHRRRTLAQNFKFPKEIILFSAIGAVLISFLMELLVLLCFLIPLGVYPKLAWLLLPVPLAVLLLFTTAFSMFLPVLAVEYQDMERIWEVLSLALFYLTPIFYPLDIIGEGRRGLLNLNPVTQIMTAVRGCLIDGSLPNPGGLAAVAAAAVILFAAGWMLLRYLEFHIVDKIMEP